MRSEVELLSQSVVGPLIEKINGCQIWKRFETIKDEQIYTKEMNCNKSIDEALF